MENGGAEVIGISSYRFPQLQPKDRKALENWALSEAKCHRYTLADLSDETGYAAHTLEFLLFRTGVAASDFGANIVSLKGAVLRRYTELSKEMHEVLWDTVQKEVVSESLPGMVEKAQDEADDEHYPWTAFTEEVLGRERKQVRYECREHGERFSWGETCLNCLDKSEDDRIAAWDGGVTDDIPEFVACEKCKAFSLAGTECVSCSIIDLAENREALNDRKALMPPKAASLPKVELPKTCSCKTVRNRACKERVKFAKEVNGKLVGFCNKHWESCSEKRCKENANFTTTEGVRYCHKDSRRKPGESDTSAGNSARIMEVRH